MTTPPINLYVKDERWLQRYKAHIALSGSPGSLTDEIVLRTVGEIVNSDALSMEAKYHMLDAFSMRVANDHSHGPAAAVLETISNEMIALTHPEWRGRRGEFVGVGSARQKND